MSIWDLALYGDPNWQRFYGNVQASEQRKGEMYARNRAQRLEGEQAQAELEQRGQIANMEAAQRAYENEAQREFQSEQMQQRAAIEQEQAIEAQVREYDMWRKKMDVQLELKKEPIERYVKGRDAIRAMVARGELAQKDAATALEDLARETDMTPQELEHQIEYQTWKKVNTPMQKQYDDNKVELPDGTVLVPPGMFDEIKPVKETPEQYKDRMATEKEEREAERKYKQEQTKLAQDTNRIKVRSDAFELYRRNLVDFQKQKADAFMELQKPYDVPIPASELKGKPPGTLQKIMRTPEQVKAAYAEMYGWLDQEIQNTQEAIKGINNEILQEYRKSVSESQYSIIPPSASADLDAQEAEIDRQIAEEKAKRGIQ